MTCRHDCSEGRFCECEEQDTPPYTPIQAQTYIAWLGAVALCIFAAILIVVRG